MTGSLKRREIDRINNILGTDRVDGYLSGRHLDHGSSFDKTFQIQQVTLVERCLLCLSDFFAAAIEHLRRGVAV